MAIQAITLPTGETFTISDWGDYPIWSRAQMIAAQAQAVTLFNYVEAAAVPGGIALAGTATKLDTNLEQASSLPLDHQMVVFSCQIKYDEVDSNAAGAIQQAANPALGMGQWASIESNCLFEFTVGNTHPFLQGPLNQFPSGAGYYQQQWASPAFAATTPIQYYPCNGMPTFEAARALALPIHIGPLQTFKGRLSFDRGALPTATQEWGVTVFLYGPRQRPVG